MIFGKVAKSLISLGVAGVAAVVLWPGLADYIYPDGSKKALALRETLPGAVTSLLPSYKVASTGQPGAGSPPSGRPGAGGPPNTRPAAGRPGAAGPGTARPGAQRPGAAAGGQPGRGSRRRGPRRPVPVLVGKVTKGEVPFLVEALGTTKAFATVNVKSRVDSIIQKVLVADGAKVKAGEVLVELDSRQIRAQIKQAKATLAKDIAENQQAKRDVARYEELLARRSGNKINVENARLKVATTAASIEADKAQIENLEVQLTYYTIKAPITGRIGIFNAKPGNTIRAGDNSATGILVTIIQSAPIYVSFSLPQNLLPEVRKAIETGIGEVTALPQGSTRTAKGRLKLIENAIDTATGTITVHAIFDNEDDFLWPGQLCNLRVILRRDQNVLSVPREAMQSGQDGNFVFIVEDGTAKVRQVKIRRSQDGRDILESGLNGDEVVVTEGALSLRNGSKVQVRNNQSKRDS
ncbi:MAG: efflux RND transporter periplasmic adaptor subunit [Hyphomicrobiales bacterium]|nr:efflux RND transporter periplasmic adaptor subunit [Hyphomicrobiales bacterium]